MIEYVAPALVIRFNRLLQLVTHDGAELQKHLLTTLEWQQTTDVKENLNAMVQELIDCKQTLRRNFLKNGEQAIQTEEQQVAPPSSQQQASSIQPEDSNMQDVEIPEFGVVRSF